MLTVLAWSEFKALFIEWIRVIINPTATINIPAEETQHFQIFADIACDQIWFHRNKT